MPTRRPIATCTDTAGEIFTLRRSGTDASLTPAEVRELLAEVRGNPGSTAELTIEARTYLQSNDSHNSNHVRFRDGALQAIARSFVDKPFLRDHNARELLARGGKVIDSKLERSDDGVASFRQTIQLVKPWAIEAALDGTLDRFSIGWRAVGPVTCTVCGAEYERGWFGLMPSCDHEPGKEYEVRGGAMRLAEAEFSGADGVEVSGVSVPAVPGTGIDGIRAALADGGLPFFPQETNMLQNIARALGLTLAASADPEAAILAEIERRTVLLDAERRGRAEAEAQLAAQREQLAARRREEVVARAVREGKCKPVGELHDKIISLAAVSIDAAEALVNELPRVTPVNLPLVSIAPAGSNPGNTPALAAAAAAATVQLTAEETEVLRQLNENGANLTASDVVRSRNMAPAPSVAAGGR